MATGMMEAALKKASDGKIDSLQDAGDEKHRCDKCKMANNDNAARLVELVCIQCEEKLCIACGQGHANKEGHLVVALNEQKEIKKCEESNFCNVHDGELAGLYCACCRKVICGECEKENHSSHNCSRVEDVADLVSKQAEAEYENLLEIQRHFDKERGRLCSEKTKLMKTIKEMEIDIQKRCDEITEFVYNESKALLAELAAYKKERLEEIEMERRKMEEHAFTFEKFKEYCDQIKRNINPRYTCEAEGVLRNVADDLLTRPGGRWKSKLFSVEVSILKTDITQVLTTLGKLTINCPYKMTQSGEIKLDEKDVCGMTVLHDKLYLLSSSIFIRRLQHPFAFIGEIKTQEIKSAKEIVSCSKISCLYIYDKDGDCVWKVSVPDHRVSLWLDTVQEPGALSVTSNAELLMLKNSKPVCLEVYNEHAILVRRVKLPITIPSLRRFDETPAGKYIGLGEQSVFTFKRNGSLISQMQPACDARYRGNPQCINVSPYHIFLQCCTNYSNRPNPPSVGAIGFTKKPIVQAQLANCSSISSLTHDLANSQILVDKSDDWIKPVASCYLKETKQLLVLEDSVNDKVWKLKLYDVTSE